MKLQQIGSGRRSRAGRVTWLSAILAAVCLAPGVVACSGGARKGADATSDNGPSDDREEGQAAIVVNELMPSNQASNRDEFDEFDDWIELYNLSDADVNLAGFAISDDPADPLKVQLTADLTIRAKGVLLLWADKAPEQGPNHISFNLKAGGEFAILTDSEGRELDRFQWTDAVTDQSFARVPDGSGEFVACAHPTPNALNGTACP